jgi:hypothetical protein
VFATPCTSSVACNKTHVITLTSAGKVKPVTFSPGVTSQYIMEGLVGAFTYSLGGGPLARGSLHTRQQL